MIKLASVQIKNASRSYGNNIEKEAFDVNLDPSMLLGSIAGGYVGNRVYNKKKQQHDEKKQQQIIDDQKIENNTYDQVSSLMQNLKIVFTPINVIYNVNGQVFEIVGTDEMTPHMKQAFLQKDADYFKKTLLNKVDMEMQMAEQAFSQRLLASKGYDSDVTKEASYVARQHLLGETDESEFKEMEKKAKTGLDNVDLTIRVNFDNLRPFEKSTSFFNLNEIEKVAGIFDIFQPNNEESVGLDRINNEVNVGFLPDRVVFIWGGNVIEQMSLLQMNQEGYEAFRKQDKQFFINQFQNHTEDVTNSLAEESNTMEQQAAEEPEANEPEEKTDEEEKTTDLTDFVRDVAEEEITAIDRDAMQLFSDFDIHPMAYETMLRKKYGKNWANNELDAIFKQLEVDYKLEDGIADEPFNKITILHAISDPENAMFFSPISFEKFVRGLNSNSILWDEFQGNETLEEILFALDIAKAYSGEEVFFEFHDNIAPYVAEELMEQDIRYVSSQLYDNTNPSEKAFFDDVNGFLMRKWKEQDSQGLTEEESKLYYKQAEQITEIAKEVTDNYADDLDIDMLYERIKDIINNNSLAVDVETDDHDGIINIAVENVVYQVLAAIFLEYKDKELEHTLEKLDLKGVE